MPVNLDEMDYDELIEFAKLTDSDPLWLYAKSRARAIELRQKGHIRAALRFQLLCNRTYLKIPADLRW
jgi:hypothetical protein